MPRLQIIAGFENDKIDLIEKQTEICVDSVRFNLQGSESFGPSKDLNSCSNAQTEFTSSLGLLSFPLSTLQACRPKEEFIFRKGVVHETMEGNWRPPILLVDFGGSRHFLSFKRAETSKFAQLTRCSSANRQIEN